MAFAEVQFTCHNDTRVGVVYDGENVATSCNWCVMMSLASLQEYNNDELLCANATDVWLVYHDNDITPAQREPHVRISITLMLALISVMFCFRLRRSCIWLIEKKWFDYTVLFFIALNCITLAMERPHIPNDSVVCLFTSVPLTKCPERLSQDISRAYDIYLCHPEATHAQMHTQIYFAICLCIC